MEDFIQALLTFTFVIIALISYTRKKARELERNDNEQLPEEWPVGESVPKIEPETRPVKASPRKYPTRMHPDSQEDLTPELERLARRARQAKKVTQEPLATSEVSALPTEASPEKGAAKHPLIADFDPKKAVIWSEIMKPKFKEENE